MLPRLALLLALAIEPYMRVSLKVQCEGDEDVADDSGGYADD